MRSDEFGKKPEHADGFGIAESRRAWIDGTKRTEKPAILEDDRHRNVTLKPIHRRGMMATIHRILGHMIDDDRLAAGSDFVTDRRLDLELTTRLQAKFDRV